MIISEKLAEQLGIPIDDREIHTVTMKIALPNAPKIDGSHW
jgi:hypothetical protein